MRNTIQLTIDIKPEDNRFVATCRELEVSSFGETVEDATRHLVDAVELYLGVLKEDGELERIYRERGISKVSGPQSEQPATDPDPDDSYTAVRKVPVPA